METRKVIVEKYPTKIIVVVPINKDDRYFLSAWYSKNVGEIFYVRDATSSDFFYGDISCHFNDYYFVLENEYGEDFSKFNACISKKHCTKKT